MRAPPHFAVSDSTDRATYYGASDVACILGLPGAFHTAYEVWAHKTGAVAREDISRSPDIRRGNALEAGILELLGQELGAPTVSGPKVTEPAIINRAVSRYAGCHPDGYVLVGDDWHGAEVKAPRRGYDWGEEDTDEVPVPYWAQVQVCLALTGLPRWYLGALLHGDVRVYPFEHDAAWTTAALARCDAWFERHVLGGEEPPVDASPAASAVYTRRIRGETRDATDEEAAIIRAYAAAKAEEKRAADTASTLRTQLLQRANGARLTVGTGKGAWGLGLSAVAGRTTIDAERLRAEFPAAYAATAKTGNPYTLVRTFGIKE